MTPIERDSMSTDLPQTSNTTSDASPNGARPGPALDAGAPPTSDTLPLVGGVVAALTALVALVLAIRSRRREPSADERLVEATQALGAAAAGLGGRAAKRTAAVVEPAARDAAALTVTAAQDAAGLAAAGARKVASVAADGAGEVVDGVATVQKAWSKLMTRLTIIFFGSAGYVLGARAGRERYDQIVAGAKRAQRSIQGAGQ
jgi:hypothetical protein